MLGTKHHVHHHRSTDRLLFRYGGSTAEVQGSCRGSLPPSSYVDKIRSLSLPDISDEIFLSSYRWDPAETSGYA